MKGIFQRNHIIILLAIFIPIVLICCLCSLWFALAMATQGTNNPKSTKEQKVQGVIATNIPTIIISTSIPTNTPTLTPTPTFTPSPTATPVVKSVAPAPKNNSNPAPASPYSCNCSKTCTQISSCAEAQYQLNQCGCKQRDADHDGIACDSPPLNCQH